jgi:hypothetical protein
VNRNELLHTPTTPRLRDLSPLKIWRRNKGKITNHANVSLKELKAIRIDLQEDINLKDALLSLQRFYEERTTDLGELATEIAADPGSLEVEDPKTSAAAAVKASSGSDE